MKLEILFGSFINEDFAFLRNLMGCDKHWKQNTSSSCFPVTPAILYVHTIHDM